MTFTDEFMKVLQDPDYVAIKRFSYSLEALLQRYPDGCPDHVVAAALIMNEGDVPAMYDRIVARLRQLMGVPVE